MFELLLSLSVAGRIHLCRLLEYFRANGSINDSCQGKICRRDQYMMTFCADILSASLGTSGYCYQGIL